MRIITGSARGRKLKSLPGTETRPTSDRLKESMFSIVQFAIEGRSVLDLFAGSGQLGLEALSRGAKSCVFVDMSAATSAIIRDNVKHTGFEQQAKVYTGEALRFLQEDGGVYDLILMDPPYRTALLQKALKLIVSRDLVRPGGLILCECASDEDVFAPDAPYAVKKTYGYGKKRLILLERKGEDV